MSVVTKVEVCKKNKNRVSIFVDGEFFMATFDEVAYFNNIKAGAQIDEQKLKQILAAEELAKAESYAIKLLSKFIKTEKEVVKKLTERGYSPETISAVMAKLKQYGYVNDACLAESYKNSYAQTKSKMAIKQQLKLKGVSEEIINALEFSEQNELAAATKTAEKWLKNKDRTKENMFKLSNFLYGKGFKGDVCKKVVSKFSTDLDDELADWEN